METFLTRLEVKKHMLAHGANCVIHRTDADRQHPLDDKMRAIEAASTRTNVTELKSHRDLLTTSFQTLLQAGTTQ